MRIKSLDMLETAGPRLDAIERRIDGYEPRLDLPYRGSLLERTRRLPAFANTRPNAVPSQALSSPILRSCSATGMLGHSGISRRCVRLCFAVMAVLLGVFMASFAASAAEFKPPIVLESPFPEQEGWFGQSVSTVPDVNGDGRPEILICAGGGARSAYLYDGVSRQMIMELTGGWGLGIDDDNGDGRGDVIVSADVRVFDVLDGTNGSVIYTLEPAETFNTEVRRVSAIPDLNGDSRPEIAIALATFGSNPEPRVVKIYDGASGTELRSLSGAGLGSAFGESVSGIPDVNGDGRGDVIVGAPLGNRAYIYDGATGALLRTLGGSGQFGRSVVGLNDVNGDGRGDVVVTAIESRRAYIYDGANGTRLQTLNAPGNPAYFGWMLNRLPDINGDGRDDVVVGPPHAPNAPQSPGNVYLFSGVTGELLATLPGHAIGGSVIGVPDLNGDGLGEVLVANPRANSTSGIYQAGQVLLYLSKARPPRPMAIGWGPEGFKLRLTGQGVVKFELQRSEDLINWAPIATQMHTNQTTEFVDTDAKNASRRFYRTRTAQ